MPEYLAPGVYVEERDTGAVPIEGVGTSTAGFLGQTERGTLEPELVTSFAEFERKFGGFALYAEGGRLAGTYLGYAVEGFFRNGGSRCFIGRVASNDTVAGTSFRPYAPAVVEPEGDLETTPPKPSPDEPARLDFGAVEPGREAMRTLTLTNRGTNNLRVEEVNLEGEDAAPFSVEFDGPTPPYTLAPGKSMNVVARFEAPNSDANAKNANLTIEHSGSEGTTVVALWANRPNVDLSESELDFGTLASGAETAEVVTIANRGESAVTIEKDGVSVQKGDNTAANDFTVVNKSDFDDDVPLPPRESKEIQVRFKAPDTEQKEATLTVEIKEGGPTLTADLVANVPRVETPGQIDFEGEPGGRETKPVTITNRGEQKLTIEKDSVTITAGADTANDEFAVENGDDFDDDVEIGAGESEAIKVTFAPKNRKAKSATLEYALAEANEPTEVSLAGNKAVVRLEAVGPGVWGSNVAAVTEDASQRGDRTFRMRLRYWAAEADAEKAKLHDADTEHPDVPEPDVEEVYDDLSADEKSSNYYENRLNDVSNLVEIERKDDGRPANGVKWLTARFDAPAPSAGLNRYKGDETRPPGERAGLAGFKEVDEIAIVCAPDEVVVDGLRDEVKDHCENLKDRFAVLQAPQNAARPGNLRPPVDTKYAAFYYPWIEVLDPVTELPKLVPPGGHVAGIYARSDTERGVHKAPANEIVRGARKLQFDITKGEQEILNPRGVNCIRSFQGRGIRVWGARTTTSLPNWKYVNVRRLFIYIEESIDEGTQWVVFEPNDERLWARVRQTVSNFLTRVWRDGALMGTTAEEAFYVKCDRSTMTQDDIDNGRLIVEIGVAPVKPAEFVIFRISQWTAGAEEGA